MPSPAPVPAAGRRLLQLGALLFLLGLLIGFALPALANPRMGLASHLEGVTNGMFLMVLGLVWPHLRLGAAALRATFWLAVYGAFANVAATLLAAVWGAGSMMPLAGGGAVGTPAQERVIGALLISLAVSMVAVAVMLVAGLRRRVTSG